MVWQVVSGKKILFKAEISDSAWFRRIISEKPLSKDETVFANKHYNLAQYLDNIEKYLG